MGKKRQEPEGQMAWLRRQSTGVVCALLSAGLLGAGSFWMDRKSEVYRSLRMDDLRFFLEPIRWEHSWLYALAAVVTVWGLSALLCTYDTLRSHIKRRVSHPAAYGAPLLHLCFALGLVAHLWGGLTGESRQHIVGSAPTQIAGARYALAEVHTERYPNRQVRSVTVELERQQQGKSERVTIGYNQPLLFEAGAKELLLMRQTSMPIAVLMHRGERVSLAQGATRTVKEEQITLLRVYRGGSLRVPVAELSVTGQRPDRFMVPLGAAVDGRQTRFVALRGSPAVLLTERDNPSMPLVLLTSLLAVVGVLLVVWQRLRSG